MTFIPSVLSVIDANNSYVGSLTNGQVVAFVGTDTSGYNSISVTVDTTDTSSPLGLVFSVSSNNVTWTTHASDTVNSGAPFTKNYDVIAQYYRLTYTAANAATISIQARLTTTNASNDSYAVFDNALESSIDAFGKLRVTNPYTLLDIRFPGQSTGSSSFLLNSIQLSQYTSGTAGSTYNITASNSKCILSVTGDRRLVNQSRKYCNYQPGKSLLFMTSAVINHSGNPAAGYSTRLGYYDDNNGLYFQYTGGAGMSVNIQNDILTTIPQSSWNIDKMDGTGSSKLNLDFTKTQLFVMDMEWLGVGRVRYGFYAYGKIHYCHQQLNINFLVAPYTNGINLPVRYEVIGSEGVTASMTQICSTVISEGGYNPIGRPMSISTGSTYVTLNTSEQPILLLRGGGSNYDHQSIFPTVMSLISNQQNDLLLYRARVYRDSIPFTVSTWTDVDVNNSVCQYALGGSVSEFNVSDSTLVDQAYFYGKTSTSYDLTNIFNNIFEITSNASNVSDVVVLTAQSIIGSGSRVYGTINWQEVY